MKQSIVLILTMAMLMSCSNKKAPFDYSTLPSEWTMLANPNKDGYVVCDEADKLTIEDNKLTHWYIAAGEKWELEIINSYQKGDTVIFNVKSSDDYKREFKFIWSDKDAGIAEWIFDKNDFGTFASNEKLSEFPKVNCSHDDEDTTPIVAENKSKDPEDLIRSDETIFSKISGDLNNDGEDDCVIITKQTKEDAAFVKNQFDDIVDRNRRGILIAFKKGEYYNTVLAIPDCFSSENEDGGVYFAPELHVEIVKGNLRIHYGHGRYGWWRYTFRYRNNDFELIGYDQSDNRGPVTESRSSINFLTKKMQTLTNTNPDADGGEEVFDERWDDIVVKHLVKLVDIKDFDEFSASECYTGK